MNINTMPLTCQGNVLPASVVKLSHLADMSCEQAVSGDVPFGISQEWTKGAEGTPFASDYAGVSGDSIMVYTAGKVCRAAVKSDAPSIQAGNSVGPNSLGEIITVNTGWAVGWLMESGSANTQQRLRIYVFPHYRPSGSQS